MVKSPAGYVAAGSGINTDCTVGERENADTGANDTLFSPVRVTVGTPVELIDTFAEPESTFVFDVISIDVKVAYPESCNSKNPQMFVKLIVPSLVVNPTIGTFEPSFCSNSDGSDTLTPESAIDSKAVAGLTT